MDETKNTPVSDKIRAELERPEHTSDELLQEMTEHKKKTRLVNDMRLIDKRGDFVNMTFNTESKS